MRRVLLLFALALCTLGWSASAPMDAASPSAAITVSGTITDPSGRPVPNVWVAVNSSLDNQGMFAIGYYHQRQALFTKSTDKKEENND